MQNRLLSFLLLFCLSLSSALVAGEWGKTVRDASRLQRKGDLKGAEATLLKALLMAEPFGEADPRLALTLDYLGTLNMQMEEPSKAQPIFERALKGFEASKGATAEDTLETATRLAECLQGQGKQAEAELYFKRVAEAKRPAGKGAQYSQDLNNWAFAVDAQGRYAEALPIYEQALVVRKASVAPSDTAEILSNMGRVYYLKGDLAKAESLFLEVLAKDEKQLGKKHLQVAEDLKRLAPVYQKAGKQAEAEAAEKRAAAIEAAPEEKPQPKATKLPKKPKKT